MKRSQIFRYDSFGRLKETEHADGAKIVYGYDIADQLTSVQDERHTTPNTKYRYDAGGRLAAVEQVLASAPGGWITTSYGYDLHGNLTSVTDPNGNVTTYAYDDFGQMLKQISAVSGTTTYAYDLAGNLVSSTDANGATTTRTYDAADRVVTATSTAPNTTTEVVTWTYDEPSRTFSRGRLTTMTDPTGQTTYDYERRGLLRREVQSVGTATYTTSFRYDADGNRNSLVYPSGATAAFGFDLAGRPVAATYGATSLVTAASYLPFGPATSVTYGNGTARTMTYDDRYRLNESILTGPGGVIASYDYDHDAAGNITGIDDVVDPAYNRTFGYDDLNRLTSANAGASLWGTGTYAYDAMGNLQAQSLGTARSATFSYQGTTPKLSSVVENGATRGVQYDDAGNEVAVATELFGYSSRNHLTSGPEADYAFDGRGIRTTSTNRTTGARPVSLYTPELNLLAETESTTAAQPAIAYEYIWFNGEPLAQVANATSLISYYFNDHLGAPILQTDNTGAVVWRVERDPYGERYATRVGAERHQPLGLPGQEYDASSDRQYNIARWYRPSWGRYTQVDPIIRMAAHAPYEYVGNAPTVWTDPLGLLRTEPGPPPRDMGTVFCDGNGGIAIQIDPRFTDHQYECYAAICLVVHEQQHASDFMMASQNRICEGKPRGTWILYTSQREEDIYEFRADQAELDCLNGERCNTTPECRTLIDERIRQLNGYQAGRRRRLGIR